MHITAEVREKWRKKVEDDPYSEVRASAVKQLLLDIDELRAALAPFAKAHDALSDEDRAVEGLSAEETNDRTLHTERHPTDGLRA